MLKEVCDDSKASHTQAQQIHNAKRNLLPLNINIGAYVAGCVSSKHNHKFQYKWKGSRRLTEANSDLVFVLEDTNDARTLTAHAKRLVLYRITTRATQALSKLRQQAAHYEITYYFVDAVKRER